MPDKLRAPVRPVDSKALATSTTVRGRDMKNPPSATSNAKVASVAGGGVSRIDRAHGNDKGIMPQMDTMPRVSKGKGRDIS